MTNFTAALPFGAPAIGALNARFKVRGIPTLVIVTRAGALVTVDGREAVSSNPTGFPWAPRSPLDILRGCAAGLVAPDGAALPIAALEKCDRVGIYCELRARDARAPLRAAR